MTTTTPPRVTQDTEAEYARRHAFVPPLLPPQVDYLPLLPRLTAAHREIGTLSGALIRPVINPALLLTPLLTKEAVSSSSIEGTTATLEQVFQYETERKQLHHEELRRDAQEIINYRRAIETTMQELQKRPIAENLLLAAHSILLDSVRGANKRPGEFRTGFVYIGNRGAPIEEAAYIPPPPEAIPELMRNWETYANLDSGCDPLIRIASSHYQFEAIHPFADGNGRIGRLLIPLHLVDKHLLPLPVLYISEFFELNRDTYVATLRTVAQEANWTPWFNFFLEAISHQAQRTTSAIHEVTGLYERLKSQVAGMATIYGPALLDQLFIRPVVNYPYLKKVIPATPNTIYSLLDKFIEAGILVQATEARRNRIFIFPALLELLK